MADQSENQRTIEQAVELAENARAIKRIIFAGCTVMIVGLLMVMTAWTELAPWGIVVLLGGATVAMVGKAIQFGKLNRDPW